MMLADLYKSQHRSLMNNSYGLLAGIAVFAGLPFIISLHYPGLYMLKIVLLFLAFYLVLFNDRLKRLFSEQLITIIGGMCYSIYLLHTLIMSGLLHVVKTLPFMTEPVAVVRYGLLLLVAVLGISALFYKLIEQPCMRKDWWKRAIK
jgi:peptidoglycan/LPS O-acetylase OafA/YrhL